MSIGKPLDSRLAVRLRYDMQVAPGEHPQSVMRKLGQAASFTVIGSTAQSLGDCWWFWVVFNTPGVELVMLPDFLSPLPWAEVDSA